MGYHILNEDAQKPTVYCFKTEETIFHVTKEDSDEVSVISIDSTDSISDIEAEACMRVVAEDLTPVEREEVPSDVLIRLDSSV